MSVIDTRLPALLKGDKPLVGMFMGITSPALVEMCGYAGFDFVVLDNEHGPASIETTEHLIRAAKCANVIPVVRTLEPDILRVLDIGASAIQVPQVNTAEQARRIVAAAKYPPVGARGAAFSPRAAGYGFFGGAPHAKASNEGTSVILMMETREALGNLDEILAVPGVDALFIGPNDLSFSMGHAGNQKHPEVVTAIETAIRKIVQTKVAAGLMTMAIEDYHKYAALGARYLTTQIASVVGAALKSAVAAMRSQPA
ncbi:MAG TPA: aldolase/citrate lyase family protein [Burkholderiaceae bacterium]|nr:aldolase/citrate lyase family protein [Burkholderiaceae bacterium]